MNRGLKRFALATLLTIAMVTNLDPMNRGLKLQGLPLFLPEVVRLQT